VIPRPILRDKNARIPFSVIGIFLIIGSSLTAVYITRLDLQKSYEIARSLEFNDIDYLLSSFEADIGTALNTAGTKALAEIGKNPVITSSHGSPDEINKRRIKDMICKELMVYLTGHYLDNTFSDGCHAINVKLIDERLNLSFESVDLEAVPMQLQRFTIPLIGPNEVVNHSTYFVAKISIPVEIRILRDVSWELLTNRTVDVSCLLISRFPLLETLMNEFHQSINGTFSSLWTFTTTFSNLYSLIRGFKHYRCGEPLNVVDNHHLALMVNSGLFLQESLVFGGVDALGLVQLAQKTMQTLRQTPMNSLEIFNTQMKGTDYEVNTENLSKGSANVDANDPFNESIDQTISINLSDIAERILFDITSVTFYFENDKGDASQETILFEGDIQKKIQDMLSYWANQSYFLTQVIKHRQINTTTWQRMLEIIADIYDGSFSTLVCNRSVIQEHQADPGEGWNDGGATLWNSSYFVPLSAHSIKPPKGEVFPGSAVYEECFEVLFVRTHQWWRMEQQMINGTSTMVKVWQNLTDFLVEHVILQSLLQHSTQYQETMDDVVDVLYFNDTCADINLEDTIEKYVGLFNDSSLEKRQLLATRDNIGEIGLDRVISGDISEWVCNQSWGCLEEILTQIGSITLHPDVNQTSIPDPFLFLEAARDDLLMQYDSNYADFVDYHSYHPGSLFCSVGKKAVYYVRVWYAGMVRNITQIVFSDILETLNQTVTETISSYAGFTTKNITETIEDVSDAIRNQFVIPFGYPMNLTRFDTQHVALWDETVRLGIDHIPHYLDPFEPTECEGEELWTLKIRNRCVFGPTGLPLLPPSPVTPWLLTMNLWVLDVQGEYARMKIIDTSDETIFNPLLGHEPQTYVRELKIITFNNTILGENTRLGFNFTTVAFSFVPPWGMMVGDIQENWFDDHTPGFT